MYVWSDWGYVTKLQETVVESSSTAALLESKWKQWLDTNDVCTICLTLQNPSDNTRLERARTEFARVGLAPFMYVFNARRPNDDEVSDLKKSRGTVGCWYSHMSIMDWTLKQQPPGRRVLIFEDDAKFTDNLSAFDKFFENSTRLLRKRLKLDILFLGHIPVFAVPADVKSSSWRVRSFMTHAYLIQPTTMNNIVQTWYRKDKTFLKRAADTPIDAVYATRRKPNGKRFRAYATYPMLCPEQFQSSQTDIPLTNMWSTLQTSAVGQSIVRKGSTFMETMLYFVLPLVIVAIIVICLMYYFFF